MVLWVGVDDTDSLRGMCTTFLATEFVRELIRDFDLIGYPRLVRLNPNIPWKTRGNGAVAMAVGRGHGRPKVIGQIDGDAVRAFSHGDGSATPREVLERLVPVVERWADLDSEGTDPGLVVLERKPRASLYWEAVREIVPLGAAKRAIADRGISRGWKAQRGLIGASAACAWRPRDRTWEVLAYRHPARWGSPRSVVADSVRRMDRKYSSTFNNYDYDNNRLVIAPRTPCPVLFGIRGDRPADLPFALRTIRSETPDRWLIFLTNQGTDDHVRPAAPTVPRTAGTYRGIVTRAPWTLPGGHVVFGAGNREVTVYEPAKQLRAAIRGLVIGDRVEVIGSLREDPRTVNLEKLHVVALTTVRRKVANPICPECGDRTKSQGRAAAFRCPSCHREVERTAAVTERVPRTVRLGWYEPPTGSRRHLSKPLKRMGVSRRSRAA